MYKILQVNTTMAHNSDAHKVTKATGYELI